ncbi:prepilin peptidase [Sphingomonas sp.]|uniref:prepilin peptidase n=1 Tax=Sphingomonas sp. TaxID=28214 RepID=UPI002C5D95BA|nr:prepilin peptidase [Sphingomonas sp.]HWK34885.1 prepilin peptidase [Sphingomonas sp.]
MSESFAWPALLGVLGLVFGSFIATVAIRWPAGRSALAGRSACDGCARTLGPLELVPLVGYLALRGRCRTCGAEIAPFHPVIESIGALIGLTAGLAAPGWGGVAGAGFGWLLLALAAIDFRAFWLPDGLTAALALAGAAFGAPPLADRLIGGVAGFAALWLVAAGYRRLRGREGLGGGDAKLFGAIGLWLGWRALPGVLLVACLIGLAVALIRRMRASDRLPLGTLLAAGAFAAWLAGSVTI